MRIDSRETKADGELTGGCWPPSVVQAGEEVGLDPSGSREVGKKPRILNQWNAEPTGLANRAGVHVRGREESRLPKLEAPLVVM